MNSTGASLCPSFAAFNTRLLEEGCSINVLGGSANEKLKTKKTKRDKKKQQSIALRRRSSSYGLHLGDASDFCEFIPMDLPPEKRLHSLLQHCIQFAINESCSEIADPELESKTKLTARPALESVLDDLLTRGVMNDAVMPSKRKTPLDPNSAELVASIKMAEDYIEKLKDESFQWDSLLREHRKEATERSKNSDRCTAVRGNKSEKMQKNGFDHSSHSWKLAAQHDRLHIKMTSIAQVAKSLHSFSNRLDHHSSQAVCQLYIAASGEQDDFEEKKWVKSLLS